MGKVIYDAGFYAKLRDETAGTARLFLTEVFRLCPGIRSVVDAGCGVGAWLAAARELGAQEICGLEGAWLASERVELAVPLGVVRTCDLALPWNLEHRFDLAISLEVAEHLPPSAAEQFVAELAAAAPRVLFSAAVPYQGGIYHQNEQWQSYWARLFVQCGMAPYDVIRPKFWSDGSVNHYYRQNTVLYLRPEAAAASPVLVGRPPNEVSSVLDVVHPEQLRCKQCESDEIRAQLDSPWTCMKHHGRRWLKRAR